MQQIRRGMHVNLIILRNIFLLLFEIITLIVQSLANRNSRSCSHQDYHRNWRMLDSNRFLRLSSQFQQLFKTHQRATIISARSTRTIRKDWWIQEIKLKKPFTKSCKLSTEKLKEEERSKEVQQWNQLCLLYLQLLRLLPKKRRKQVLSKELTRLLFQRMNEKLIEKE